MLWAYKALCFDRKIAVLAGTAPDNDVKALKRYICLTYAQQPMLHTRGAKTECRGMARHVQHWNASML